MIAHIEWSIKMVDVELKGWENHFLNKVATDGPLLVGPHLERLHRHLAIVAAELL